MASLTKSPMKTKSDMKIQPLADRVVVRPLTDTKQMRGGLYIPDTAKEKPQQGEIIAVGLEAAGAPGQARRRRGRDQRGCRDRDRIGRRRRPGSRTHCTPRGRAGWTACTKQETLRPTRTGQLKSSTPPRCGTE